jgi:hypothetical protein
MELIKAERPAGTLANGKQYFLRAHHPAHKSFTGQEHAEASQKLHAEGHKIMSTGMDQDDAFGIHHGRTVMIAAKHHAEQAKAKGLPPSNKTPRS